MKKMYLTEQPKELVLDFWREYSCHIQIKADGKLIGECETGSPVQEDGQQCEEGQASGEGAFAAHQSWLTKRREIGFAQQRIAVQDVPVGKEFTLTIQWQGKGKMCTYQFCN